jgi:hypothetical protein
MANTPLCPTELITALGETTGLPTAKAALRGPKDDKDELREAMIGECAKVVGLNA